MYSAHEADIPIRFSCGLVAHGHHPSPPFPSSPAGFTVLQGRGSSSATPRVYQRFYDVCRPRGPLLLFITTTALAPWRGANTPRLNESCGWISKVRGWNITFPVCLDDPPSPILPYLHLLFGQGARRETRFLLALFGRCIMVCVCVCMRV